MLSACNFNGNKSSIPFSNQCGLICALFRYWKVAGKGWINIAIRVTISVHKLTKVSRNIIDRNHIIYYGGTFSGTKIYVSLVFLIVQTLSSFPLVYFLLRPIMDSLSMYEWCSSVVLHLECDLGFACFTKKGSSNVEQKVWRVCFVVE